MNSPSSRSDSGDTPPPPSWRRVHQIFRQVLDRPPDQREAYLSSVCAHEPLLLARVRAALDLQDSDLDSDEPTEWEEGGEGRAPSLSPRRSSPPRALDPQRTRGLIHSLGHEPKAGDLVGRYRLKAALGRGGMGMVFLAFDPILQRDVALKLLPPGSPARGRWVDQGTDPLLEEARAASALDHPHIGTVYEVGTDDRGQSFMAMACYDGGTLRNRLSQGPLPHEEAVSVALQVARGLAAAHQAAIIHRDIKPENLVFDGHSHVKIVDFGMARSTLPPQGGDAATGGTLPYMSPELISGAPSDEGSDLWALGVVLFEMLTGERPFPGRTREEIRARISESERSVPARLPGDLPPSLRSVVTRALTLDPAHRFSSAHDFADALQTALDTNPDPEPSPSRRTRSLLVPASLGPISVAVGILAILLGGAFVMDRQQPRLGPVEGWSGPALEEPGRILVADFDAVEEWLEVAMVAREALVVDLQQSTFLSVATRREVAGVLGRMGLPADTPLTETLALEVAERAGIGLVLTGQVAWAGSRVVISARALDAVNGSQLFALRAAAGRRRILGAVEELSRETRLRLGETSDALLASQPLPQVTTTSLEALRLYAEAERILLVDNTQALELLQAAIQRDPSFAMAHRLAGAASLPTLSYAQVASHLEQAWIHRDRLPELERWHVEALYASEVEFDPFRSATIYELIRDRYPQDRRARINLGVTRISWLDDPHGARAAMADAMALDPQEPVALSNAIHLAFIAGDLTEVESLLLTAEQRGLDTFLRRWRVGQAFALLDADSWQAGCREILDSSVATEEDYEFCGTMAVASGHLAEGTSWLEVAAAAYRRTGRYRQLVHATQALAMADVQAGNTTTGATRIQELIQALPSQEFPEPDRFITRTNLQIQAALMGRHDLVTRIGSTYPPFGPEDHWFGLGGEALVRAAQHVERGNGQQALATLQGAFPRGIRPFGWRFWDEYLTGLAQEAMGRPDLAAHHLEEATHPGYLPFPALAKDRIYFPLALEALARVEEAQGNEAGARSARDRLARLRGAAPSSPVTFTDQMGRESAGRAG